MENSPEETRALMRLEGELNSTLFFEYGGHQLAIMLWVANILLDFVFHKRLALGWMVKSFEKHYPKESMRSLVKLQDLLDLAEPPLGSFAATASLGQMKNEVMGLDKEEEEHVEHTQGGQGILEEANLDLG